MKRLLIVLAAVAGFAALQGCANEEPKATQADKANIDRLAKEGIGARPIGGDQPAKAPSDAEPAPP